MLSVEQKQLLTETAARYHEAIDARTASYLQSRGITKDVADSFLLGTVSNPAPGHEPRAHRCVFLTHHRSPNHRVDRRELGVQPHNVPIRIDPTEIRECGKKRGHIQCHEDPVTP